MSFFFILPPFRQYGGKFFLYFLFLALSGPIALLFIEFKIYTQFGINQNITILLFSHLLIYALLYKKINKKNRVLLLLFLVCLSVVIYSLLSYPILFIYFIVVHFCVIALILKMAIKHSMDTLEVKLFYAVLLLYEMMGIGKYLSLILDLDSGLYYLAISNIFQILFAIFFTFVREDKPRLALMLTNHPAILRNREDPDYLIHDRFKEE